MIIIAEKYVPLHSPTHAEPHSLNVGAAIGREHYILKCVADALFLASLNLGNSNVQFKDIAEVGAAGRYIPFPLVCRWLTMPSSTPLGAYYIYQRRGYHSVSFTTKGCGRPQTANRQKPDTPLFFCS